MGMSYINANVLHKKRSDVAGNNEGDIIIHLYEAFAFLHD